MVGTTYCAFSSVDGYIAGVDDSLDWLYGIDPADRDITGFLSEVGAVAMGAATYESILRDADLLDHPERWAEAHGDRPAWVFTHRRLPAIPGANVEFVSGDVRPVHQAMLRAAAGKRAFIAGGGGLATAFADAGLLDRMVVGVVPVILGAGKRLFTGPLSSERLRLVDVERVGRLAYLTYDVSRPLT